MYSKCIVSCSLSYDYYYIIYICNSTLQYNLTVNNGKPIKYYFTDLFPFEGLRRLWVLIKNELQLTRYLEIFNMHTYLYIFSLKPF